MSKMKTAIFAIVAIVIGVSAIDGYKGYKEREAVKVEAANRITTQEEFQQKWQVPAGSLGNPNVNPYVVFDNGTYPPFQNPGHWRGLHGKWVDNNQGKCILAQQDAAGKIRYIDFREAVSYTLSMSDQAIVLEMKDKSVGAVHLNNAPEHKVMFRNIAKCNPSAQLIQ